MEMEWVLRAALAASVLHVIEEMRFGFLRWLKATLPGWSPLFTPLWAHSINALMFVYGTWVVFTPSLAPVYRLAFPSLLLLNSILHIAMSIRRRSYSPGVVTAVLLYLPIGVGAIVLAYRLHSPHGTVPNALVLAAGLHSIVPLSLKGRSVVRKLLHGAHSEGKA